MQAKFKNTWGCNVLLGRKQIIFLERENPSLHQKSWKSLIPGMAVVSK